MGKVISKEQEEPPAGRERNGFEPYAVRITISEIFQGPGQLGKEIVVHTAFSGAGCGYPFLIGTSYLVYASVQNGKLTTSKCSGTGPEVMSGGLLKELRALRGGRRVDDLYGTVGVAPTGKSLERFTEMRPLQNVSVHLRGSRGQIFSAKTDERGAYFFASLPSDIYRIEQDLPAGMNAWESKAGTPLTVKVDHKKEAGAACQADILARPDGQISGMFENQLYDFGVNRR